MRPININDTMIDNNSKSREAALIPILFERGSSRSNPRNGAGAHSRFGHKAMIGSDLESRLVFFRRVAAEAISAKFHIKSLSAQSQHFSRRAPVLACKFEGRLNAEAFD